MKQARSLDESVKVSRAQQAHILPSYHIIIIIKGKTGRRMHFAEACKDAT